MVRIFSLLHTSSQEDVVSYVKQHRSCLSDRDEDSCTPLLLACKLGMREAARTMLAMGADPNAMDSVCVAVIECVAVCLSRVDCDVHCSTIGLLCTSAVREARL